MRDGRLAAGARPRGSKGGISPTPAPSHRCAGLPEKRCHRFVHSCEARLIKSLRAMLPSPLTAYSGCLKQQRQKLSATQPIVPGFLLVIERS